MDRAVRLGLVMMTLVAAAPGAPRDPRGGLLPAPGMRTPGANGAAAAPAGRSALLVPRPAGVVRAAARKTRTVRGWRRALRVALRLLLRCPPWRSTPPGPLADRAGPPERPLAVDPHTGGRPMFAVATPLLALTLVASPAPPRAVWLGEQARAIVRADYRADRGALARLATTLAAGPAPERSPLRAYWEAFAWWRRGMNGFGQEPRPPDVQADFERGARAARAALAMDPAFDEARGALAGCLMGQAFAGAPDDREARAALLREALGLVSELEGRASDNPRALWMVGGRLLWPPAQGGDLALAEATFLRGLEAARCEAQGPARPAWMPTWGAPENLMSLAFLHTLGPHPQLAVARAYAEGALAMVPGWRSVRDQLLPRITRLEADAGTPAP